MPRTLGNLTRHHRRKLGYKQVQFAKMLGMSTKDLSESERDLRPLTMREVNGLTSLSGIKDDDIIRAIQETRDRKAAADDT